MSEKSKNYLILILAISVVTLAYLYWNKSNEYKNNNDKLDSEIKELIETNDNLENDKQFYKKKYMELAEDYNNRLEKLGINEYILTDTSR